MGAAREWEQQKEQQCNQRGQRRQFCAASASEDQGTGERKESQKWRFDCHRTSRGRNLQPSMKQCECASILILFYSHSQLDARILCEGNLI